MRLQRRWLVPVLTGLLVMAAPAAAAAAPPTGVTGIALEGRVDLAWQPAAGATGYRVYRGTSADAVTTPVAHVAGKLSFSDTGLTAGTTYFYGVRTLTGGSESGPSRIVKATPPVRACASANPVADENCLAGNADWAIGDDPGIEGYATAQSIDHGSAIDLKVDSEAAYDIEIFRTGYYGGTGARLLSTILDVPAISQPACGGAEPYSCAAWAVGETLTTTAAWPSGVYLARVVRRDTTRGNHILFVVRDDARPSPLLYGVPMTTYQAYNTYGGKSLYDIHSTGGRAFKVSFDRPYAQTTDRQLDDWYTRSDFATVAWLERSGYDVAYASVADLEHDGAARLRLHRAFVSGAHDEYWSAAMRAAAEGARDAGTSLFFTGANAVYWKVRS